MNHRAWFALALLFACLGVGYLGWWQWFADRPAGEADLAQLNGTLAEVRDVSPPSAPDSLILHLVIDQVGGPPVPLDLYHPSVAEKDLRPLVGTEVGVRYDANTDVIYELTAAGRRLVDYDAAYRGQQGALDIYIGAAKLVFTAAAVFAAIGLFRYRKAKGGTTA
ncbi:MAG: hypothetical protein AB7U38_14260 [Hyphomicrobiales bacterium]